MGIYFPVPEPYAPASQIMFSTPGGERDLEKGEFETVGLFQRIRSPNQNASKISPVFPDSCQRAFLVMFLACRMNPGYANWKEGIQALLGPICRSNCYTSKKLLESHRLICQNNILPRKPASLPLGDPMRPFCSTSDTKVR
jgi:hypothetical protein